MPKRGINRALLERSQLQDEHHHDLIAGTSWSVIRSRKDIPCIFISHQAEDSAAAREIGEYIMDARLDVYLDDFDDEVAYIASEGKAGELTHHLTEAIDRSSHMLCVVSRSTAKSRWVPFEIGFGHAFKKPLTILTLKDLADDPLPDYMVMAPLVRGIRSLNEYLAGILRTSLQILFNEGRLKRESMTHPDHPLNDVLQWNR